jgi:hypothetical protein
MNELGPAMTDGAIRISSCSATERILDGYVQFDHFVCEGIENENAVKQRRKCCVGKIFVWAEYRRQMFVVGDDE